MSLLLLILMQMSGVTLNDYVPKRNEQGEIYSPFMRSGATYPEVKPDEQKYLDDMIRMQQEMMSNKNFLPEEPQELTDSEKRNILLEQLDPSYLMRKKYLQDQE
jgi:hypothetical protein